VENGARGRRHFGHRLRQYRVPFERIELGLELGVGLEIAVNGAAGDSAQVGILEQLSGHGLEEFLVGQLVDSGNHVGCRPDLGTPDQHPAQIRNESGACLDERVRTQVGDQRQARLLDPAAILGQQILEFAAVVAGAREKVVCGSGI
jgi:hypothetical protein